MNKEKIKELREQLLKIKADEFSVDCYVQVSKQNIVKRDLSGQVCLNEGYKLAKTPTGLSLLQHPVTRETLPIGHCLRKANEILELDSEETRWFLGFGFTYYEVSGIKDYPLACNLRQAIAAANYLLNRQPTEGCLSNVKILGTGKITTIG